MSSPSAQTPDELIITACAILDPLPVSLLPKELRGRAETLHHRGLLLIDNAGYSVKQQERISQLQARFEGNAELGRLIAAIIPELRLLPRHPGASHLRALARFALCKGDGPAFLENFNLYGDMVHPGWHPDRDHQIFWPSVLGEQLLDAELIPESKASEELFALQLAYYSLREQPEQMASLLPDATEELLCIHDCLCADLSRLRSRPSSPLSQACILLLQGEWQESHRRFNNCMGRSLHAGILLQQRRIQSILPLALLAALRAKAGRQSIDQSISLILKTLPSQSGLALCTALAKQDPADACAAAQDIRPETAFDHMLLAILPSPQISGEQALQACAANWPLYAHYIATALPEMAELAIYRHKDIASIAPLRHIASLAPIPELDEEKRIFWDIQLDETGQRINKVQPRILLASDEGKKLGRPISYDKLRRGDYAAACSQEDLRLIQHISRDERLHTAAWSLNSAGIASLSHHPRLRLIGAASSRSPLQLLPPSSPQADPRELSRHGNGRYQLGANGQLSLSPNPDTHALAILLSYREQVLQFSLPLSIPCPSGLRAERLVEQSWQVTGEVAALHALQLLKELAHQQELQLLWQGSEPIRLRERATGDIQIQIQKSKLGQWLEIGAQLAIDESLVYELRDLLPLYQQRVGNCLPLGEGQYLPLSPKQEEQLAFLSSGSFTQRRKQLMSPAAQGRLHQLWPEQIPSSTPSEVIVTPATLQAQLRPYQEFGFRWLAKHAAAGCGCCIADEMGLGKTIQLLSLLLHRAEQGPSLIIAPLSLLRNWCNEAAQFAPTLRVQLYSREQPLQLAAGDILIASYGQITHQIEHFSSIHWDCIILDEAQAIKNPRSQRSRAINKLHSTCRIAATGSPLENHISELCTIINILNPNLLGSIQKTQRGLEQKEQLSAIRQLIAPLILRRRKKDVLPELPSMIETLIAVELSKQERALYESHRRAALESLQQESHSSIHALAALNKMRRICCHGGLIDKRIKESSKLTHLAELLQDLLAEGHRVLIFSQFSSLLRLAQQQMTQQIKLHSLYLDGKTPARERAELVEQFQNGAGEAFFISLKAGGTGLNLTAADSVILLDPWWNPASEAQAAARAHRIGQDSPVTLFRIISCDTVEEQVLELQREKKLLIEDFEQMSADQLQQLLDQQSQILV